MMKAIVLKGVNEAFRIENVEIPTLSEDEVLVKVHAAALNHRDIWIQKGQYAGLKFPIILGSDGVGVVVEAGGRDGRAWIGQEVVLNPSHNWGDDPRFQQPDYQILGLPENGALAEYVKIPVKYLHDKPAHLSSVETAALPLAGLTAYRALFSRAQLKAGETVLISGVGGGVALLACQFAIAADAKVYVSSSKAEKIKKAIELGALGGVNYREDNWGKQLTKLSGGIDVVIDSAAGEGFANFLRVANPGGRIVLYGGTRGKIQNISPQILFWKQLNIMGTSMGNRKEFEEMLWFVEENEIHPVVDEVFDFQDIEAATQKMKTSGQFGKIVIRFADE